MAAEPVIVNQTFDGELIDILKEIAEQPIERHCARCYYRMRNGACMKCRHMTAIPIQNPNHGHFRPSD